MKNDKGRYVHIASRKHDGAHFTPEALSEFLSFRALKNLEKTKKIRVLEPAIGDGELVLGLLKNIRADIKVEIVGFDINKQSLENAKSRILSKYPSIELTLIHGDFLSYSNMNDNKFDLVLSNPPYVRSSNFSPDAYEKVFHDLGLKSSSDLYYAFILAVKKHLNPNGVCAFIVSNKFLSVKSASILRGKMLDNYGFHELWDFGDCKLFEASVLPLVMIFSLKSNSNINTKFHSIYEHEIKENYSNLARNPIEAIKMPGVVMCDNNQLYQVKHGNLNCGHGRGDVWSLMTDESERWSKTVEINTWLRFGDIGKIRVGVKTTADNVFIMNESSENSDLELVKPLITHHISGRYRASSSTKKGIIYPHEMINNKIRPVNLRDYPNTEFYLNKHRLQLESRKYIQKAKRKWFELWVPQNPSLWKKKKIVFRDICEKPTFWIDESGSIVNGDCYWLVNDSNYDVSDDVLWLILAVANSSFIEKYYDTNFNNKLYGKKRRYMSQYVEKFPLPNIKSNEAKQLIRLAKNIYQQHNDKLEKEIDKLVFKAFGLEKE